VKRTDKIWMDGDIVPWEKATIHVMTHSLHYGTAIFEGIRLYKTDSGPCIFRLDAHMKRLYNSTKIYGMSVPFTQEELEKGIKQLARENHIEECYIRPIVYYGWDEVGVDPTGNSVHVSIVMWPWLPYLGEEGLRRGIRCKISSWARIDPRSLPTMAKAAANYANSVLARMEARKSGYQEAILLNAYGLVTEGTGENLFAVRDGTIFTPPLSSGILPGITRDSIIKICADLGLPVKEKSFTRGELLTSDEVFLVGTAAEVTPVREIDDRLVGSGTRGPITEKVQSKFFEVVRGKDPRYAAWLEPV
jgi:branched-chain amino acid aminotransferase